MTVFFKLLLYTIEAKELLNQKEAADLQRRIDALTGEKNRKKELKNLQNNQKIWDKMTFSTNKPLN